MTINTDRRERDLIPEEELTLDHFRPLRTAGIPDFERSGSQALWSDKTAEAPALHTC